MMNADTVKRASIRIQAIFTAERGMCERMVELLSEEQTALTVVDMKKIISLSVAKQDLAERIIREDRLFQDEAAKLVPEQVGGPVTLAMVAAKVGDDDGVELLEQGRVIAGLKERINTINEVNREYIRSTLGYLGDAISVLAGPAAENGEYHSRGLKNGGRRSPAMVSREV